MKTTTFIDFVYGKDYDLNTLATQGLGGTEATILRIAEGLKSKGHKVTHLTKKDHFAKLPLIPSDNFVVIRDFDLAIQLKKLAPTSKVYLWLHDLMDKRFAHYMPELGKAGVIILAVSEYHKHQIKDTAYHHSMQHFPRIKVVYNPIDDSLQKDETPIDKNKLIFFSSPHKGLNEAIELFKAALNFNKDFKLYISNPGYFPSDSTQHPSIHNLGILSHSDIISHVRSSLCVFYPNYVYPETFGLVLAEANAVGTPVLTHAIGAAREVLTNPNQLIDCRNRVTVLDTLMAWYKHRPDVSANNKFRLSEVLKTWEQLI